MPINYESVRPYGAAATDSLPTAVVDGGLAQLRTDRYGALSSAGSWRNQAAAEGTYFEFHNATLDLATTIAGHAAPVVADIDATFVKATFFLGNMLAASDKRRIYMDWLEIECTTAGANGTDSWWADQTDLSTNYTSGGTALTLVNPNTGSSNTLASDVLRLLGGPIVIPVETASCRKLGFSIIRPTIEVAGDFTTFAFGDSLAPSHAAASPTGRHTVVRRPPVVISPGYAYMLGLAATAQSVASVYKMRGAFVCK